MSDSKFFTDRYPPRYHGEGAPATDKLILAVVAASLIVFGIIAWTNLTRVEAAKAEVQKVCYSAGWRA